MSVVGKSSKQYSSFIPTDITGCAMWLDASDSTKITRPSGNDVSTWIDKSGNTRNATSAGGSYPQYSATGGNNSKPAITFGSNNDALTNAYDFTDTSLAYFMVIKPASTQPGGGVSGVLSTDTLSNYGRSLALNGNTSKWSQEYYSGIKDLDSYTSGIWYFVSLEFVSTSSAAFTINGTASTVTPNASNNSNNTTGFKIGSYNSDGSYITFNANFDTSEIIVYTTSLTSDQRQQVEGYLAWKWGLTSSLPSGHPYKNSPPYTRQSYKTGP